MFLWKNMDNYPSYQFLSGALIYYYFTVSGSKHQIPYLFGYKTKLSISRMTPNILIHHPLRDGFSLLKQSQKFKMD